MGWDAHSSVSTDKEKAVFLQVSSIIETVAGVVDGSLYYGSLDCSDCGEMLEKATGQSVYSYDGWDTETVKRLNESANWDFHVDKADMWAYLSAKSFLQTCADLNLSVRFSW